MWPRRFLKVFLSDGARLCQGWQTWQGHRHILCLESRISIIWGSLLLATIIKHSLHQLGRHRLYFSNQQPPNCSCLKLWRILSSGCLGQRNFIYCSVQRSNTLSHTEGKSCFTLVRTVNSITEELWRICHQQVTAGVSPTALRENRALIKVEGKETLVSTYKLMWFQLFLLRDFPTDVYISKIRIIWGKKKRGICKQAKGIYSFLSSLSTLRKQFYFNSELLLLTKSFEKLLYNILL